MHELSRGNTNQCVLRNDGFMRLLVTHVLVVQNSTITMLHSIIDYKYIAILNIWYQWMIVAQCFGDVKIDHNKLYIISKQYGIGLGGTRINVYSTMMDLRAFWPILPSLLTKFDLILHYIGLCHSYCLLEFKQMRLLKSPLTCNRLKIKPIFRHININLPL